LGPNGPYFFTVATSTWCSGEDAISGFEAVICENDPREEWRKFSNSGDGIDQE